MSVVLPAPENPVRAAMRGTSKRYTVSTHCEEIANGFAQLCSSDETASRGSAAALRASACGRGAEERRQEGRKRREADDRGGGARRYRSGHRDPRHVQVRRGGGCAARCAAG